jgi:hypothetical protein
MMQHQVGPEHLEAIGDITVSFAMLESVLQGLVHTLLGTRLAIAQTVTAEISFKGLRALAASLWIERYGKAQALTVDFLKLMTRIRAVEEKRNQVTHSLWAANEEGLVLRIKRTAKETRGLELKYDQVAPADLAKIAGEIKRVASEVQSLHLGMKKTPANVE